MSCIVWIDAFLHFVIILDICCVKDFIFNIMDAFFFIGAKVRGEIYEAFENIYPILKGFRK